jgi:tRNA threonylcarbamoyladenosine dehydratase
MSSGGRFGDRTEILVGSSGIAALGRVRVAVYGLGGVGAACAMDLVRAGVGELYVVDFDTVDISNLNRLYFGYTDEVGRPKTEVFARFARSVNPEIKIQEIQVFFSGEEAASTIDDKSAIHADCVDSLNAKVNLIASLLDRGSPFISSMGTAGRLAPERLRLGNIWESSGCPLAKSVRTRLRRMGIDADFPVVWSDEPPVKPRPSQTDAPTTATLAEAGKDGPANPKGRRRMIQGSSPFVPQTAGHIMASWIVRRILADGNLSA